MTSAATAGHRRPVPNRLIMAITIASTLIYTRSIEMYTMHEALARERMRTSHRDAQQRRVAREMAAARRWHRLGLRAHAAGRQARAVQRRRALRVL